MSTAIFIIIGIFIGLATGAGIFIFITKKTKETDAQKLTQIKLELGQEFNKLSQDALKNANEYLITLARERIESDKKAVSTELGSKKDLIAGIVEEMRKEIQTSREKLEKSDADRIASFSALQKELENHKQITGDLQVTAENLKKILSNNQLRGQFGEQVAENLLRMAGFVVGSDYVYNQGQETVHTRPDFTVFLPDKTRINIDVKFPYSALVQSANTEDKAEKQKFINQFRSDVRNKIKQVTTRDYINPEEKTVDFVILFVPNEMIFSFIYDQLNDVCEEAMQKKVVLAGPFSFTAILRLIKQSYANFRYQENLHQVIGHIQKFKQEFDKYSESVDDLGKKLTSTVNQFNVVANTRTNQLNRVVEKIDGAVLPETETPNMLPKI